MSKFDEVIENYLKEAEEDFNLDKADLEGKLRQIPNLNNKWLRHFYRQSHILIKKEKELSKLYREKLNYYMYEYEYEIKFTQSKFYIESDEEYSKMAFQVNSHKKVVEMLESILKKTTQLSFDINNLLRLKELKAGK